MFIEISIGLCQRSWFMNEVFKALNDPIRRDILKLLREKDLTVGEIVAEFTIGGPTISHHLDKLKRADLVTFRKEGQFIVYSINTTILDDFIQYMLNFTR